MLKNGVKYAGVIQILRQGDAQRLVASCIPFGPEVQKAIQYADGGEDDGKQNGKAKIAHSRHKPHAHGQKQAGDLFSGPGDRAKTHQAEGAGNRDSGAHIAVHHHDHHADHGGQQRQRYNKTFRVLRTIHIRAGQDHSRRQRNGDAKQEVGNGYRLNDLGIKNSLKQRARHG